MKNDVLNEFQKKIRYNFKITNEGDAIALLLELQLYYVSGNDKEIIVPIIWGDNYFSIRGKNSYETYAEFVYDDKREVYLDIVGWNTGLNKEHKMMRLKNWEFGNSEKIKLSPEQISKGESSENLFKAPEDFYVCTAMGGLSGHTNDYYYEMKLKEVDKEQFDVDWWFRSYFEFNDTLSKDNLTLLHINGINYKSDIYIDVNLVAKK